jgi:hypothetical protein
MAALCLEIQSPFFLVKIHYFPPALFSCSVQHVPPRAAVCCACVYMGCCFPVVGGPCRLAECAVSCLDWTTLPSMQQQQHLSQGVLRPQLLAQHCQSHCCLAFTRQKGCFVCSESQAA